MENANKEEVRDIEVYPELESKPVPILWNYTTIKKALRAALEKYQGLIVTEDNLRDMERAHREIVNYRTQLERFKKRVRSEYDKPKTDFTNKCNQLLNIVSLVEAPLKSQLDEYETRREDVLKEHIHALFFDMARRAGISEEFATLDFKDKWLNRTQKWKDTVADVEAQVAECGRLQSEKRQLEELINLRREMLERFIADKNEELQLARPIKLEHMRPDILNMSTADARAIVTKVAEEEAAREAEVKKQMEAAEQRKREEAESKAAAPAPVMSAPRFIGAVGTPRVESNLFPSVKKQEPLPFKPRVYHIHAIVRTKEEEDALLAATKQLKDALVTSEEFNSKKGE